MDFLPLGPEHSADWDAFCLESRDAWFWHTIGWLDYTFAYRPDLKPRSLSFMVREGKRILAAVPLLLEHHREDGAERIKFSFGGGYNPAPALANDLTADQRDDLLERIFGTIDDLALELGAVQTLFHVPSLAPRRLKPEYAPCNELLRYGYLDATLNTRVIDLRLPENELRDGLRRNHRRNIETGREKLRTRVFAGAGFTVEKFESYRLMHHAAAGRVTRPLRTFELMSDWLAAGRGFLSEAYDSTGRGVGYVVYMDYKGSVYGLSAANDPEVERVLPVRHLLEWDGIQWMRERGLEFYEIGDQHFGALPYDFPDQKNVNISHFKYGYGGVTTPHVFAEKFHSREYWELTQRRRSELFAAAYAWPAADGGRAKELLRRFEKALKPAEAEIEVPPDVARAAEEIVAANPAVVKSWREGGENAVHFLVGRAMQGAGRGKNPKLLMKAISAALAKAALP